MAALAVGLINGVLIAYAGMPAVCRHAGHDVGRAFHRLVLSNNKMIYEFGPDHELLLGFGGGSPWASPSLCRARGHRRPGAGRLRWTKWGQHVFALGGNEQAAMLTGICGSAD